MDIWQIFGAGGGILSIVTMIYVATRVGVRVDQLWEERAKAEETRQEVAVLTERVKNLSTFVFNRAGAEARSRHAIRDASD